jgi:hypothetical protein
MNEYSLHLGIKDWYSLPMDRFEVRVDDFVVDIVRGDLLIEIQTRNFSAIKKKLVKLLTTHRVRLVYPIAQLKWIVHVSETGEIIKRRKSPKKGKLSDLFYELVRTPTLVNAENFSLDVLLIEEEEIRINDGKGSWRRKGVSIKDRRLLNVYGTAFFGCKQDFQMFLPVDLSKQFTNNELAKQNKIPVRLAQKITYCLRKMGTIAVVGKTGKELLFEVC